MEISAIIDKFCLFVNKSIDIKSFELWIYNNNNEIMEKIGNEEYIEIASIDFNKKNDINKLRIIIRDLLKNRYDIECIDFKKEKTLNKNDFYNISIRGRVAYSICCLENVIIFFRYDESKWEILLRYLWTYTTIDFIDTWQDISSELLPETIMEFSKYNNDYEYIREDEFYKLYDLYRNANEEIKKIINLIFYIGTSELYGAIRNNGEGSLKKLEDLIDLMIEEEIQLPKIDKFERLVFDQNDGYGKIFDRKEYCVIHNM